MTINPTIIILIGVVARLVPHPANFTPVAAIALFGGVYLGKKTAIVLPLSAMIISDLFIGFDDVATRISVYGCIILTTLVGQWVKNHKSIANVILASLFSAVIFFAVTNFTVWVGWHMYPKTIGGLIECYAMAIPFFRNSLAGDVFYTIIFFGGYELAALWLKKRLAFASR